MAGWPVGVVEVGVYGRYSAAGTAWKITAALTGGLELGRFSSHQ